MKIRRAYQVNEIFDSIQGEGVLSGTMATFIRLQGCTVGCHWCDSGPLADMPSKKELTDQLVQATLDGDEGKQKAIKESIYNFEWRATNGLTRNTWSSGGTRMNVEDIMAKVQHRHVVITGGEPTLYDLDGLLVALSKSNHYVQLETSGQNRLKGCLNPHWITWSPKENLLWNAPYDIKYNCQEVKWVVEDSLEWDTMWDTWLWMVSKRPDCLPWFVMMPEGSPPKKKNEDLAMAMLEMVPFPFQPWWRYCDRLQYRLKIR